MPVAWADLRLRRASDRRWLAGATLLLVFATASYWRESISLRLVPDPRMNQQLERAQSALAEGRLSASDGSGARELFESVLATDPEQMLARNGLLQVRTAAIRRAESALRSLRLSDARKHLDLAQALSAPAVQLQPLRVRLRDLENASANTAGLLAQAAAPGISDEAALALLEQVLRVDADNPVALEARDELLASVILSAEKLLEAGDVEQASRLVSQVMAADPAHSDLPAVRGRLGELQALAQRGRAGEFERAQADLRAGRLDSAARRYQRLAASGGDSVQLRQALHALAARAAREAERNAADFKFKQAEALLERARSWSAQAPEIAVAEQRLQQARRSQQKLPAAVSRRDRERLPALLADAGEAMQRGDFITPPGASAWDKLRVATAIAPGAVQVRHLQLEFARRSRECFEQSMTAGHLRRAQSCLEASLAQDPMARGAADAQQRLAERWLAYADERIGASDYPEAETAIGFARRWQPSHPGLGSATTRLRRARGGKP